MTSKAGPIFLSLKTGKRGAQHPKDRPACS